LVPVYRAGLWVKDRLRAAGVLTVRRLGWPVVSVGSLSAGGAGKTPVVMALAEMLKERGWAVDVLSRGYGRSGRGVERVAVGSVDASLRYGDEPVVMSERTGVPVWVGSERYEAGVRAEAWAEGLRGVHVLDDGFQHRGLGRTVDVVLVTAVDLEDELLPAGNLREPLSALRRADVVAVRVEEMEAVGPRIEGLVKEGTLVWSVRRKLRFPAPLFVFGAGLKPVAFCAIARPEGFAQMLVEAGCGIAEMVFFGDHHVYTMADIERVVEVAKGIKATGLVTTEKDGVKLTVEMRALLGEVGPLMVVELEAEILFPNRVMRELEARLGVVGVAD
jgi:tetraacyldisaccharide 4'-kinase